MSKRTAVKKITIEAKTLRYLREQRGLSMRQAALLARVSPTLINLLENGRQDIHNEHIKKLLSTPKVT